MGQKTKSEELFNSFFEYASNDTSIYKHFSLAVYYAHQNNLKSAVEQLKLFSNEDNFQYWILLFLKIDPLIDNIKDLPAFNDYLILLKVNFGINIKI